MSRTVSNGQTDARDKGGRFAPGNPGGPGNPRIKKLPDYMKALRAAVNVKDLQAVFVKLREMALDGNMDAIKELLNRALGRPVSPTTEEAFNMTLPPIETAKDLPGASKALIDGLARGELSATAATILSNLLEQHRRNYETHDLAVRIESLEMEKQ